MKTNNLTQSLRLHRSLHMTNIWYHTSRSTLIYPGVCDLAFKEATKIHVNHFANDLIFEELLKS